MMVPDPLELAAVQLAVLSVSEFVTGCRGLHFKYGYEKSGFPG